MSKRIFKDNRWLEPVSFFLVLTLFITILIKEILSKWNPIESLIHKISPFGIQISWLRTLGNLFARYAVVVIFLIIIMAIFDKCLQKIRDTLPTPRYRRPLNIYIRFVEMHRLVSRLVIIIRHQTMTALTYRTTNSKSKLPLRSLSANSFVKSLLSIYEFFLPSNLVSLVSWGIVLVSSFNLHFTMIQLTNYYSYLEHMQNQFSLTSHVAYFTIITGTLTLISFLVRLIYLQTNKAQLNSNFKETNNALMKRALETHYKAYHILLSNLLAIRENTELLYDSRNERLDEFITSISNGKYKFENDEIIQGQNNYLPHMPYFLKRNFHSPAKYSLDSLELLRKEVSDSQLQDIMMGTLFQLHLPMSRLRNSFWWEESWEKNIAYSTSMYRYTELRREVFNKKFGNITPDENDIYIDFEDVKSIVDDQIFEQVNFYFDIIDYINIMHRKFTPKRGIIQGLIDTIIK